MHWFVEYMKSFASSSRKASVGQNVEQIWLDDLYMEEFVPNENIGFLFDNMKAIETIRKNDYGFNDCHIIERPHIQLIQRRIDTHRFVEFLEKSGFKKCDGTKLDKESIKSYAQSAIKLHRLGQLRLYFEETEGLVSRIGIKVELITSVKEYDLILGFLQKLEATHELVIADWWKKQVIDSEKKLKAYLMEMFK